MPGAYLWGWSGAAFTKVLVDAAGHLQVDVITAGGTASHCMGWTGAAWTPLLADTLANANLRVQLYDGANGITAGVPPDGAFAYGSEHALTVKNILYMIRTASSAYALEGAGRRGDSDPGNQYPAVALRGYNGASFDRLRTYSTGILKIGEAKFGDIYSKTMTMVNDNPTRFEVATKNLRDVVIIVTTNPMLLGETGVEVYPVGANETIGFTVVDISSLYFKNAGAGNNGTITILGVEE